MNLKTSDVKHVAKLAKLELTKLEVERFRKQLSLVLEYVDQLKEVNTSEIVPTSQTTGLENVTRKDKKIDLRCFTQKQALSGSKKSEDGYFVVDRSETIGK